MNGNGEIIDNKIDDLYMVFVINNRKYALSSKYIIEIIEMLPITKVPFSILVVILSIRLSSASTTIDEESLCSITKSIAFCTSIFVNFAVTVRF